MADTPNMDFAEGWRPSEGDVIVGKVLEVDRGWSDWTKSYYPIVTIQPDEGARVAIHAFHTTLRGKLTELRPLPGERLAVKYMGERPLKSDPKRTVHVYNAKVMDRAPVDAWANFEDERKPEVEEPIGSDIPKDDVPF
jgi:hypothetical protein